ncbi:helix-turn-helix domain-containing protein, partial [Clostridium perfringens]
MGRIRKDYMVSEKNLEYIEEIKEKNDFKYSSEALDLIIREHRENEKMSIKMLREYLANEISEALKDEFKMLMKVNKFTDKNTQVIIEMLNGMFIKEEYGKIITTNEEVCKALTIAENTIEERINKNYK